MSQQKRTPAGSLLARLLRRGQDCHPNFFQAPAGLAAILDYNPLADVMGRARGEGLYQHKKADPGRIESRDVSR